MTPTSPPLDSDGDGVPDVVEDGAPNGGDGNGDGVLDKTQSNVASLPSATGGGYVTVVVSGAGGCGQLMNVLSRTEWQLGYDPNFDYPFGLTGFQLNCATSSAVTVYFHAADPANPPAIYRKFGLKAPNYIGTAGFYTLPGVVFGTTQVPAITGPLVVTATFTLTDNQLGDGSATLGLIVDPGGPAIGAQTAPVTSSWGLTALVGLLAAVAMFGLWRHGSLAAAELARRSQGING